MEPFAADHDADGSAVAARAVELLYPGSVWFPDVPIGEAAPEETVEEWLPLRDAAHAAGVPLARLRRWCERGDVPYRKEGGRRIVLVEDVRARAAADPFAEHGEGSDEGAQDDDGTPQTDDEGVEQVLRSARAAIARLSLELRAVRHKAEEAERAAEAREPVGGAAALDATKEFLRSTLSRALDTRRAELASELEETRAEAAFIVESARRRADAYVAAAYDGVLATLVHPGAQLPPLPPLPPVVDPHDMAAPVDPAADPALRPAEPQHHVFGPTAWAPAMGMPAFRYAAPPMPAVPQPVRPPGSETAETNVPSTPFWSRLLFADVLLPLIAAVLVLIILLAWVG